MSKKFKFRASSPNEFYIADLTVDGEYAHVTILKTGTVFKNSYKKTEVAKYVARGSWTVVEDLEGVVARDGKGEQVTLTLDDIKDFMRVKLTGSDDHYVVYTNARVSSLPKYATNGNRTVLLDLSQVEVVYSQPEGKNMLDNAAIGKLRFKKVNATKLTALQAKVAAAEAALEAAKAELAAV